MTSSSFGYAIIDNKDVKAVIIIDSNIGSMSVTRDIKNVVNYILNVNNIDRDNAGDYLWIYKDADDIWDGYDPIEGKIVDLACFDVDEAIGRYLIIRHIEMQSLLLHTSEG